MAITCTEVIGRKTRWSYTDDGVISFGATRKFIVRSDTRLTGFESVPGLPAPNESYPTVPRARVSDVSATEVEKCIVDGADEWVWHVDVNYSTQHFKIDVHNELEDNPLDRPVSYKWSPLLITITPLVDLDGKKFLNSLKDPMVDPPTITVKGAIVTATKNYSSFSAAYALSLIDKVNISPWLGCAIGTAKISSVEPEMVTNGETSYAAVSISVEYNPLGWDPITALDAGTQYIDNATSKKVYARDENGYVSTEPVKLNGYGFKLEEGAEPIYHEFRMSNYIDFNTVLGS